MIRNAEEMAKEYKERMRGGNGTVEITHIFKGDELKGKCRLCALITLKPGTSIGLHEHNEEEEIFYITEGAGRINDNGTVRDVTAGDAILTGGGGSHSVENTGDKDLKMLAVILLY